MRDPTDAVAVGGNKSASGLYSAPADYFMGEQ
jgi:hypothetical protein